METEMEKEELDRLAPKEIETYEAYTERQAYCAKYPTVQPRPEPKKTHDTTDLYNALQGIYGGDQQLIAEVGLEYITTLLKKNRDYGSSVFQQGYLSPDVPVDAAIRVRMGDKIARFRNLVKDGIIYVKEETLVDTMKDLGAYAILWSALQKRNKDAGISSVAPDTIPIKGRNP